MLFEINATSLFFESNSTPGGLVRCTNENGILFHRVGGHVFNEKNEDVAKWFLGKFDRENEFLHARRNTKILLDGRTLGYPIENYLYNLPIEITTPIIEDFLSVSGKHLKPDNFDDFLRLNFGETLYKLYSEPYNRKFWTLISQQFHCHCWRVNFLCPITCKP